MAVSSLKMDIAKQPGIICNSVILVESIFKREPEIPQHVNMEMQIEINNSIAQDSSALSSEVILTVNKPESSVYARVTYVGIFTVNDSPNLDLNEFADCNAPAIIFPYIREEIHNRMMKAGIPLMILPPINIKALVDASKCK